MRPAVGVAWPRGGDASARLLRFTFLAAAVAAALVGTIPFAHGQDAPAASPAPSSAAPASQAAPASSSTSGAAAASGQGSTGPTKSDPVCFQLTGHCVDSTKAPGAKAGSATAKTAAGGKKPLNLKAPDISTVVPEQELKEPLPNENQVTEVQEAQTVSVKTEEGVPPDVPGGLGAIWWAVVHPSQAWRIVTPAE